MELDEVLKRRFSCRSYKDKEISQGLIEEILNAAVLAPSSGNMQNWRFIIVKDKNKKREISIASLRQLFIAEAPVLIVICNEIEGVIKDYGDIGKSYSMQNCTLASANIMLKAADLNLDTCYIGAFDEKAVRRILNIPDSIIPEIIITLGYGKEKPEKKIRNPITTLTFFERYGNKKLDSGFFPVEKQLNKIENKLQKLKQKIKN